MKIFLCASFASLGLSAVAPATAFAGEGLHYDASLGGRLLPLVAGAFGHLGYASLLWAKPDSSVLFGYVQPSLNLGTSLVVNTAEIETQVRPISFFGITVGPKGSTRFSDLSTIDCPKFQCRGALGNTFARAEPTAVTRSFFAVYGIKAEFERIRDRARSFADEATVLVGQARGDHRISHDVKLARWSAILS